MKKFPIFSRKLLFPLCTALLVSSPVWAGELENHIDKASVYVKARDYRRAIREYEEVIKINPDHARTNLLLGLVYADIGDLDQAVKYTEKALELDPSYNAYNNLALVYANRADFDKAIDNYEKAMAINPSAFTPYYHMGLIYSAKKDYEKALTFYKKAVELNSQYADAYVGLGSALYYTGDKAGAWGQVEKLKNLKFKPQSEGLADWLKSKENRQDPPTTAPSSTPSERNAQG